MHTLFGLRLGKTQAKLTCALRVHSFYVKDLRVAQLCPLRVFGYVLHLNFLHMTQTNPSIGQPCYKPNFFTCLHDLSEGEIAYAYLLLTDSLAAATNYEVLMSAFLSFLINETQTGTTLKFTLKCIVFAASLQRLGS